ncbi:MAG: DUF4062 domain-containing protein [Ferruginibacter sp.]
MKERKLQIFVSSTYTDLKEERQAAVEAILSSGHIPAGMELFSAGDESQLTVIQRWIDESDIYLLILGGRYGSIDTKSGKSYTELEYDYAVEKKKPLFAVVINESILEIKVKSMGIQVIEQENPKELKQFRLKTLNNLVKFWDDKKDIKIAIHETLSDFSYRKDLVGWIRGNNLVDTAFLAEEIARLTKENSELRSKISDENIGNSLYSSLTYNQLEDLLKKETVDFDQKQITLFEYIIITGKSLTTGIMDGGINDEILEKLRLFKLTIIGPTKEGFRGNKFSEDGHNFYLKAKFLEQQK